jgi:hypothetical protein
LGLEPGFSDDEDKQEAINSFMSTEMAKMAGSAPFAQLF